ncbi:hypothetical protein A9F13_05g02222 [Clavispora lusitaniae]|uniref:Uncharacterized protein n=1 Tax=Clavispora lusitaniae TaxID=36911 RepID=A0AA91Q1T7_CLALS|nr:hypothetical protein A9F13_05g02222 [Clavispora lusitaniae]
MSQESKEGLLDQAKDNSPEKLDSDDESTIPVEVEFKIWDKSKYKTSSNRLRFVFNEDLSVKEASERAFETYFGDIPQEISVLIQAKGSSLSAIANVNVKIKRILKEGDTLILSDDLDKYNRRQTIDPHPIFSCFLILVAGLFLVGLFGLGIFSIILSMRELFTALLDNGYLWK